MDYIQFIALFATLTTYFGFMYRELKQFQSEIREDIKAQSLRSDAQSLRSDKLYEMFYELLKEGKK